MRTRCSLAPVRVALAVCALVLAAPAAALAREPVISYVDENGVFRLYDEETESEENPAPPVPAPANFLGFRYGMSMSGRYIVYNDNPAPRHLHLLDRATNTLVPLPGIDVYANPDNLTVSNNGSIAFDNQGNGPAVVYSSAARAFIDSGLAADNAHRQTRLSGDGHFLGTTCDSPTNCAAPTVGADAFVQDLTTKSDTAFPADATRDEEHACLDGDGSIFGIDKAASATDPKHDIFLFQRSGTPVPLPSGVNTADVEDQYCVLDSSGRYLGFMNNFLTFMLYDRTEAGFVTLPAGKEFDRYSVLSDPYSPPQPPGGGVPPGPTGDRTKPVITRFRMAHRRFRVRRRATSFKFRLSEPGRGRIVIRRRGKKVGEISRRGLDAGSNTIAFSGKIGRRKLRPGEYAAVLIVTDRAGNRSLPVLIEFRVLRPKPRRH
jgi:hypothetical protein